jgi:hypothetical protein
VTLALLTWGFSLEAASIAPPLGVAGQQAETFFERLADNFRIVQVGSDRIVQILGQTFQRFLEQGPYAAQQLLNRLMMQDFGRIGAICRVLTRCVYLVAGFGVAVGEFGSLSINQVYNRVDLLNFRNEVLKPALGDIICLG